MRYQVVVGNIGQVIDTHLFKEALETYSTYKKDSLSGQGRAGGESVVLMQDGEVKREHQPKPVLPPVGDLVSLIKALKKDIGDDDRATDDPDDDKPGMCVTIGWSPNGSGAWSYQTGDNSFTGGAYGHPHWAVVYINRRSNSREVVRDIHDQLMELASC
jgi:hypothetical protein